ncbi:MAG: S49 family peptidase [Gammaproteobacteria bacterium]|nr:S49 family peptidase [Gammaproteobacteria bacterium]
MKKPPSRLWCCVSTVRRQRSPPIWSAGIVGDPGRGDSGGGIHGTVAASGGYWIAAEADEIWAEPTTITGSIGVFGMVPTFEDTLAAVGIHNDGVGTSPFAGALRLDRPMSEPAARLIQGSVDNLYRRFVSLVATGRDMDVATVDGIAEAASGPAAGLWSAGWWIIWAPSMPPWLPRTAPVSKTMRPCRSNRRWISVNASSAS